MTSNKKLILTIGIPASGKTTWAKDYISSDKGNTIRANRDDIRSTIFGVVFDTTLEGEVTKVQDYLVTNALRAGKNVIIDDTNINKATRNKWHRLAKTIGNTDVVEVCFPIDLAEAKRRNNLRDRPVPDEVMARFWKNWCDFKSSTDTVHRTTSYGEPLTTNRDMPTLDPIDTVKTTAIICDLDGTLAKLNGRDPYHPSLCEGDGVNALLLEILNNLKDKHRVIFVSGRSMEAWQPTLKWLKKHIPWNFTLYMRAEGDTRPDEIVKKEIYHRNIEPHWNVVGVFDDRPKVVRMWRHELGLDVYQLDDREF